MSETLSCCRLPENAPFHTYEDVIRHLDGLGLFHMDMGLGRMERALTSLGLTRLPCPAVQIVGTNGKGSTSVFLQSLAMAHGLHTGLYTSPHFVFPEERIRHDHTMLPRKVWPGLAAAALHTEKHLTYFELLTVMAALAFHDSDCQLTIFEAGLGGRYDATSALPADMVCFVPIGLDHTAVLGDTISAIADDKSDALRSGVSLAISAPQPEEAQRILEEKAAARGIPLCSCPSVNGCGGNAAGQALWNTLPAELRELAVLPKDAKLGLRGPHQRVNAQTALLIWILLCARYGWKTDRRAIEHGLAAAFIPGRLQYAPATSSRPALWLDGAHNAHGMAALKNALCHFSESERPGAAVFSCLSDKNPELLTSQLREALGDIPVFIPTITDNPRAARNTELAAIFGRQAFPASSLEKALSEAAHAAAGSPVLVCGSLYLLAEVFTLWPDLLEPAHR